MHKTFDGARKSSPGLIGENQGSGQAGGVGGGVARALVGRNMDIPAVRLAGMN